MSQPAYPIVIDVPGVPAPGGSKKAFTNPRTGRIVVLDDAKGNGSWKSRVATFARQAYHGPLLDGPLRVRFEFTVMRPKGHFGTGRNATAVKASAPAHPTVKPDVTKIIRSTEDSLSGVIWRDDALIVEQYGCKRYGDSPGVRIVIEPA